MVHDAIRPYDCPCPLTHCHTRANHDVLAEPGATADSDGLYSRKALIHDGSARALEGVAVIGDVNIPGEQHALLDDHLLGRG